METRLEYLVLTLFKNNSFFIENKNKIINTKKKNQFVYSYQYYNLRGFITSILYVIQFKLIKNGF